MLNRVQRKGWRSGSRRSRRPRAQRLGAVRIRSILSTRSSAGWGSSTLNSSSLLRCQVDPDRHLQMGPDIVEVHPPEERANDQESDDDAAVEQRGHRDIFQVLLP